MEKVIYGKKLLRPACLFQWCEVSTKGRRAWYDVAMATATEIHVSELSFDPTRQQWSLEAQTMCVVAFSLFLFLL